MKFNYDEYIYFIKQVYFNLKDGSIKRRQAKNFSLHDHGGSFRVKVNNQSISAHKLMYYLGTGLWSDTIKHLNGDKKDNRLCNLASDKWVKTPEELETEFFKRFIVDENSGCWNWQVNLHVYRGYGMFWTGRRQEGYVKAHRWSFRHFHGEDPGDLYVCHKCDNPQCVNPDHLFLGTQDDNMKDMKAKGRRKGVNTGPNNGRYGKPFKHSEESKRKMSLARKGKKHRRMVWW